MRYIVFILILMAFDTNQHLMGQEGKLYLNGKVVDENKRGLESTIYLYKNGARIDSVPTSRIGRFTFSIDLLDSIAFVTYANGYVSKTVFVDGRLPLKLTNADYIFPFFIDLYPVGSVPSHIDLERPVGKIIFSGTQFIYDIEFTERQNERLKEFVRERRDLKVRSLKE
jgi:hypothetical protein